MNERERDNRTFVSRVRLEEELTEELVLERLWSSGQIRQNIIMRDIVQPCTHTHTHTHDIH